VPEKVWWRFVGVMNCEPEDFVGCGRGCIFGGGVGFLTYALWAQESLNFKCAANFS